MPLEMKPVYTLGELAKASGLRCRAIRGIMTKYGVTLYPAGARVTVVLVSDLRDRMPSFWDALLDSDACLSREGRAPRGRWST